MGGAALNVSTWRHIAIAISNRYLQGQFGGQGGEEGEDEFDEDEDDVADLQAGHSSFVAGMIYAREVGQGNFGTAARRFQFRQVSQRWHRLLRFPSAGTAKRKSDAYGDEREQARYRRFKAACRVDLRMELRRMMGPEAQFRGGQEEVIRAIVHGESPVMQIVGTGGGKSLSFMLPAFSSPGGTTIVISPMVALGEDMRRRCEAARIDSWIWDWGVAPRAASIVFVTPEAAHAEGFHTFVERLRQRQQLDRVVVDECHLVLDSGREFRAKMRQTGRVLQQFSTQLVFLTATLAPRDEREFYEVMRVQGARVRLFRSATTRRNIRYRARSVRGQGGEEGAAVGEVRAALARYASGKVIVYGQTVETVERLAGALGCAAYHSKVADKAGKRRRMREWVDGGRVIVATNALGVGIDVPDVRVVIHVGAPRRLRDFAQESGRAGRDGAGSESVIVWRRGGGQVAAEGQAPWREAEMEEYVQGQRCRRVILDSVMDGREDRMGCVEGEVFCGVCEGEVFCGVCEGEGEGEGEEDSCEEGVRCEGGCKGGCKGSYEEGVYCSGAAVDSGEEAVDSGRERVDSYEEERVSDGEVEEIEDEEAMEEFRQLRREEEWMQLKSREERQRDGSASEYRRMVEAWAGTCAICRFRGDGAAAYGHEVWACEQRGEFREQVVRGVRGLTEEMFGKRVFERFSGCFACGLPQAFCSGWAARDGDGGSFRRTGAGCQYRTVLVEAVVGMGLSDGAAWRETIGGLMAADGLAYEEGDAGVYRWLGRRVQWGTGGLEWNNLGLVFVALCKRVGIV
jgi:superfamily II DNA or RNA helicase